MEIPPYRLRRALHGWCVCLFFVAALALRAQPYPPVGAPVAEVVYDPPQQPLAPEDLSAVQQVARGEPYSSRAVAETIDRMFATGAYFDIQVDATMVGSGVGSGVRVTFITKPAGFVGHVRIQGKTPDPPTHSSIVNATELQVGTPFAPGALEAAEQHVRRLLIANGLYESDVNITSGQDPVTQLVSIAIQLKSGERARYEMPEIRGDTKLSNSTILRATGWRVILIHRWRQVTQALTSTASENVRRKYQQKDRLSATVELTQIEYDAKTRRLKPTLDVNPGPVIEVKTVEAKVSKGRLKKYVPVFEEGAIDDDLLVEGARNLRDYFQNGGYPDADVTFRVLPPENDRQTIEYVIARGPKKKLKKLSVEGNKYFDTQTIRERLLLLPSSFRFPHGRYSDGLRQRDEETITQLYRANGFRDVKVTSMATQGNAAAGSAKAEDQIEVTYKIAEGAQWLVAQVDFVGMAADASEAVRPSMIAAVGQPFADVAVASDRNAILTYYYAHGFPQAQFLYTAVPDSEPHRVHLTYTVQPGVQEFVRDVKILGLKRTRPSLIQEKMKIKPGDPLSLVAIDNQQRELNNLGLFARVEAAIENPEGAATRKYVLYDIDEANRYSLRLGVGAEIAQIGATTSNLNEPAGHNGFSPRFLINLSRIDFLGLGHTISVDGRISNLEQRLGLNYAIQNFWGSSKRTLSFSGLYDKASDVQTFSAKREEGSIQMAQKVSRSTTVTYRFAYRRVATSEIAIPTLLVPALSQPVRVGIASVNLIRDRRDNPADAHRGSYNTIDVGLASGIFGSQRNFVRALGRNATYYSLPGKMVLARQLTFGVIQPFNLGSALDAADAVPLPERFFGGGNVTQRGFGENQAGPRDIGVPASGSTAASQPTGFPLGGNALFFHSTELRFPLLGANIGGVIFHDMGNIFTRVSAMSFRVTQRNDQDFDYMVHAVGFGVRYKTPIGPLRVDLAYSINPPHFVGFQGTIDQLLQCNPNAIPGTLPSYCNSVPQSLSHFQYFFSIGQTF